MVRSQGRSSYSSSSPAGYLFLFLERAVGVARPLAAGSAQLRSAAMASLVGVEIPRPCMQRQLGNCRMG
jgi:hypothetical protein